MPPQDPEAKLEEQNSQLQFSIESQSQSEQSEQDSDSERRTTYYDLESIQLDLAAKPTENFKATDSHKEEKPESSKICTRKTFRESYKSLFSHPFFAPLKHKADHEITNVLDALDIDVDTDDSDANLIRYCEDFSDLNPNHDYYRFMKLGENVVT